MADKSNQNQTQGGSGQHRRSSGAYANLMNIKRNPNDAEGLARRMSASEQLGGQGVFGKMWTSFTRGTQQEKPVDTSKPPKQSIMRTGARPLG